ncbi:MAG: 6-carboxytetrahydropterin synthase [Niastella sp.]|nr:6-carboxytetrahydropterin synthase [Niastella sp.]
MLQVTKIFHFEMAHAIHGYSGACKNIHGHSYELHVTVSAKENGNNYIPATGFVVDFKELKKCVNESVITLLDHKLVLSKEYIAAHTPVMNLENVILWEIEPSAENILVFIQRELTKVLPAHINLAELKLYETRDSFAKWIAPQA